MKKMTKRYKKTDKPSRINVLTTTFKAWFYVSIFEIIWFILIPVTKETIGIDIGDWLVEMALLLFA